MANQKRREQIFQAALELFDQRGFHGTGMEDIATAVGMRASSLYNHYRSKQELLTEVAVGAMEDLLRTNATALAGVTKPEDRLVAAMRNHVIFHATQAQRVRVTNAELGNLEEPHRSVVLQLRRDYVARWMKFVDEGVGAGALAAPDVKIACWALIDMGIGVAQWYSEGGKYTAEELGDLYGQFALAQLASHTDRN
ncbi:TetR/AcrR family transcriptional regulator [uncultured Corynebacterium sp.]|uniref:TetR/AcrR family transcriptional regulator n=1 Tax=uncultured Corynebacterium sp. TaxID=159447 RepID=UPI0025DE2103|nr:TetR/AcrR family transcriptional regulator [uncultured Corynebacterium sp.]